MSLLGNLIFFIFGGFLIVLGYVIGDSCALQLSAYPSAFNA